MEKLFYSALTGFRGLSQFVKIAKEKGFSREEATLFYKRQGINQLYGPPAPSNIPYSSAPYRLMADLVDISLFSRLNKGYKFILTIIDVGSRHGWAFGIAGKSPKYVLPHLQEIYASYKFKTFTTDEGGEFKGVVKEWLASENIEQWISPIKGRTNLVELFNKIIVTRLFKIMKYSGTHVWHNVLDSVVLGYNSDKPLGASFHTQKLIDPFSIGDYVRIPFPAGPFPKSARTQRWSDEVYRILSRDRARYSVMDSSKKVLSVKYLPRQLLIVLPHTTPISSDTEMADIKSKQKFIRDQRKSNLDVDSCGDIIVPSTMKIITEKRVIKKPLRYL